MTDQDKAGSVTHRPKGNKKASEIAREPEMVRLKELLDTDQVDPDRLKGYIKRQKEIKKGPLSTVGGAKNPR